MDDFGNAVALWSRVVDIIFNDFLMSQYSLAEGWKDTWQLVSSTDFVPSAHLVMNPNGEGIIVWEQYDFNSVPNTRSIRYIQYQ